MTNSNVKSDEKPLVFNTDCTTAGFRQVIYLTKMWQIRKKIAVGLCSSKYEIIDIIFKAGLPPVQS